MQRFSMKCAKQLFANQQYDALFAYVNEFPRSANAQVLLGLCYSFGYGVESNRQHALEMLRKASGRIGKTGAFYYDQLVAEVSTETDERFYAIVRLGDAYRKGVVVPKQAHMAYDLYMRAVELCQQTTAVFASHPLFYIGYYHYSQENFPKAFTYFEKAFKQHTTWEHGEVYSLCCYFLGLCYFLGKGVEQDFIKAAEYWENDTASLYNAASQVALAVMYEKGIPPYEKNIFQADRLYGLNLIRQGAVARLCVGAGHMPNIQATQIHMGIRDFLIKENNKKELLEKEIRLENQRMQLDHNITDIALKSNVTKEHTKELEEKAKVLNIAKTHGGN